MNKNKKESFSRPFLSGLLLNTRIDQLNNGLSLKLFEQFPNLAARIEERAD